MLLKHERRMTMRSSCSALPSSESFIASTRLANFDRRLVICQSQQVNLSSSSQRHFIIANKSQHLHIHYHSQHRHRNANFAHLRRELVPPDPSAAAAPGNTSGFTSCARFSNCQTNQYHNENLRTKAVDTTN